MIILVSLLFIGVIALEAPHLLRNKMWRELTAFSGLLVIGMIYSFGLVLNWEIPSLLQLMELVFIPVTMYIQQLLS